jgi:ribonuclease H2 subunit C
MIGVVVRSTDRLVETPNSATSRAQWQRDEESSEDEEEPEVEEPVKIIDSLAEIKEIVVFDHDQQPASEDAFLKVVNEWIAFSDAIHS